MALPDFTTQSGAVWKGNVDAAAGQYGLGDPVFFVPLRAGIAPLIGVGAGTFTRSTTGTYVGVDGNVRTAAIDVARFEAAGLLMEGASTNNLLHSQDFSDAAWVKFAGTDWTYTHATGDIKDPTGSTNTATKLVVGTTPSALVLRQVGTFVAADRTASFWVYVPAATQDIAMAVDWEDVESTPSGAISAKDQWVRVQFPATVAASRARIDINITGAGGPLVTGEVVYVAFAQEEQRPFVSSYIPTTVSTVTRTADALSYDLQNLPPLNGDQTWFCEVVLAGNDAAASQQAMKGFGDVRRDVIASVIGSNVARINFGAASNGTALTAGVSQRLAVTRGVNQKIWQDGIRTANTPSIAATGVATSLDVGHSAGGVHLYGNIRNLRIYNSELAEAGMFILGAL